MKPLILLLLLITGSISQAKETESLNVDYVFHALKRFYTMKGIVSGIIAGCNDIDSQTSERRIAAYNQWLLRHEDFEDRIKSIRRYVLHYARRKESVSFFENLEKNTHFDKMRELDSQSFPARSKTCNLEINAVRYGAYDIKADSNDAKAIDHFYHWLQQIRSGETNDKNTRAKPSQNLAIKNLLKNSSFENHLSNWNVQKGGDWAAQQGIHNSAALSMISNIPPNDKYVHETKVDQCVLLDGGEKYQLRAKFRAEKILIGEYAEKAKYANRIYIIWYESSDCSRGGQSGGWIEASNVSGWQHLSIENQKPAFGAKAVKIQVTQMGKYSRAYKAFWDDIQFFATEMPDPKSRDPVAPNPKYTIALYENYLLNGSFDSDLSLWRSSKAEWSPEGYRIPGSAKVTFKSRKDSIGAGALEQCVNIGENSKFELSAMVKKDPESTQNGGGAIRVSWNNQENCHGRNKTDNNRATFNEIQDWHKLEVKNLQAPAHTHSVLIELIQVISGAGVYSVYWDDVSFKAVE